MRVALSLIVLLGLAGAAACGPTSEGPGDAGPSCPDGRCHPDASAGDAGTGCSEPNPQGCSSDAACGAGQRCVRDPKVCRSSGCVCDERSGLWACLPDCGGGTCQPD